MKIKKKLTIETSSGVHYFHSQIRSVKVSLTWQFVHLSLPARRCGGSEISKYSIWQTDKRYRMIWPLCVTAIVHWAHTRQRQVAGSRCTLRCCLIREREKRPHCHSLMSLPFRKEKSNNESLEVDKKRNSIKYNLLQKGLERKPK